MKTSHDFSMDTTQKFALATVIQALIIIVGALFGVAYYINYIKPESYTIGNVSMYDYVPISLKDYISEGDVLFAQDIADVSFSNTGDTCVYEYQFEAKEFNGATNNYSIYVNETMLGKVQRNANTVSAVLGKSYYNAEHTVLDASDIAINFSFHTQSAQMRVTVSKSSLPYLKRFMGVNNFVVTLAKTDYTFGQNVGKLEEVTSNLTIKLNNGQADTVIEGVKGYVYTLNTPADKNNQPFLKWEVVSGDGKVTGNKFTYGSQDTIIQATYDSNPFTVTYKVGTETFTTDYVQSGKTSSIEDVPTKDGAEFYGWALNDQIVDTSTIVITQNTTFNAKFIKSVLNKDKLVASSFGSSIAQSCPTNFTLDFSSKLTESIANANYIISLKVDKWDNAGGHGQPIASETIKIQSEGSGPLALTNATYSYAGNTVVLNTRNVNFPVGHWCFTIADVQVIF